MSIVQKSLALEEIPGAGDSALPVSVPGDAPPSAGELAEAENVVHNPRRAHGRDRKRFAPFQRAIDRLRRDRDAAWADDSSDESAELRLELLLLREENARLKSDRYRPPDLGTLIDYLRHLANPSAEPVTVDDAWSALCGCLAVREALTQAHSETETAIDALERQLRENSRLGRDRPPRKASRADVNGSSSGPAKADGLISAA